MTTDYQHIKNYTLRAVLLTLFLWLSSCAAAQASVTINMEAIKTIESSGDPNAYNEGSGAMGLYQITKICLDDYNIYNSPKIARNALYSPEANEKVALWYMNKRIPQMLKHFGHADNVENRLISYNCGIGCVGKNLPEETRNYINKYRRLAHDN
jgi:muramidase (phage lysozyme)